MDTRCVKILRQDERVRRVILSYWTKTLSNMIMSAESVRAEVGVTSLKRGFMCSFTLKVKVEIDSNLPVVLFYSSTLEKSLNFKAGSGQNVKFKST